MIIPNTSTNVNATVENFHIRDLRGGYYRVSNDLIRKDGATLGVYGVAVYSTLALMVGEDESCYPSYQTIADLLGCSRRAVMRSMRKLKELGWIKAERRRDPETREYTSNMYFLLDSPHNGHKYNNTTTDNPEVYNNGGSDSQSLGVVTEVHQGSDSQSPKQDPSNKTQHNNKVEPQKPEQACTPEESDVVVVSLQNIGFTKRAAQRMTRKYAAERIEAVVTALKDASPRNPAGWVRRALEEGWDLAPPAGAEPVFRYEPDAEILARLQLTMQQMGGGA